MSYEFLIYSMVTAPVIKVAPLTSHDIISTVVPLSETLVLPSSLEPQEVNLVVVIAELDVE